MARPNNDKWEELGYTLRFIAFFAFLGFVAYCIFK